MTVASLRKSSDRLSSRELTMRRIFSLFRSPLISLPSRIAATTMFVMGMPENARKSWPLFILISIDMTISVVDMLRGIPRWLCVGCERMIEVLRSTKRTIRSIAEHADRIFDDKLQ
jgi:hypothetical protein